MSPEARPWVERVKEADAEAEVATSRALASANAGILGESAAAVALIAIAAELRAQRIAQRPGLTADFWRPTGECQEC